MFGPKFYEYHKKFTQRCAAALALGKKVNWTEKDKDLLQMIIGGTRANKCVICNEIYHSTSFCPCQLSSGNQSTGSQYSRNLPASSAKKFNTVPICIFFNANGCKRYQCSFVHMCKTVNLIHMDLRLVQS